MTMTDESMMQHAIALAKLAEAIDEVPIGAVVGHYDELIAEGAPKVPTKTDRSIS